MDQGSGPVNLRGWWRTLLDHTHLYLFSLAYLPQPETAGIPFFFPFPRLAPGSSVGWVVNQVESLISLWEPGNIPNSCDCLPSFPTLLRAKSCLLAAVQFGGPEQESCQRPVGATPGLNAKFSDF